MEGRKEHAQTCCYRSDEVCLQAQGILCAQCALNIACSQEHGLHCCSWECSRALSCQHMQTLLFGVVVQVSTNPVDAYELFLV